MNTDYKTKSIAAFVEERNASKQLFTAGPASLLSENLTGLMPCFGRGDREYSDVEETVLNKLKEMTGHKLIARMQGSASLALEIMSMNFLHGRVLVVDTGYYSKRMSWLAHSAKRRTGTIREIEEVNWKDLDSVAGQFDWIVACSVETSCGLKIGIESLQQVADKHGAKLMLDATASIGLESGHELADTIAYSSCKGLFGLTGACFIAFNKEPVYEVDSFYLNLSTHINKKMTGPYHAITSLADVLPKHNEFREAVRINKEKFIKDYNEWVIYDEQHQPLLCTFVACDIQSQNSKAILYRPRSELRGSVVCHLGEVHLGSKAEGEIQESLIAAKL